MTDNSSSATHPDVSTTFPPSEGSPGPGQAESPRSARIPRAPIAETLGFSLTEMRDGVARIDFEAQPRHANPMGTLHGGVLCDITDAAMGMALASTLAEGESFTTLELKTNFLRPFWSGHLTALGRTVHRGRTNVMLEAEVLDEKGRIIAKATSTCMILRGDMARGR